jgi:ferredoxin
VFTLNDDGNLEYDGSPEDSERAYVEDAADVCPVQAILVED